MIDYVVCVYNFGMENFEYGCNSARINQSQQVILDIDLAKFKWSRAPGFITLRWLFIVKLCEALPWNNTIHI